jgi:FKBP-type peptidyl-prolyl cis-trans isomerase
MKRILGLSLLLLATGAVAAPPADSGIAEARQKATAAGIEITDLKVGKGPAIHAGQTATVHYTGWLFDPAKPDGKGTQFDSSKDRGPFSFPLGGHQVIPGWELGVAGMQKGGSRRLKIPAEQAYGARGAGGVIPPHATLVFDVKLLSFADSPAAQ